MGVSSFISIISKYKKEVTLKDLEGKTLAIDVSNSVYSSILAMKSVKSLTDGEGNTTSHILTFLNNMVAYKKHKINAIYVFDNKMHIEKEQTLVTRRERKTKAEEKIKIINDNQNTHTDIIDEDGAVIDSKFDSDSKITEQSEQIFKLEKQSFSPDKRHYDEIKTLLTLAGQPYICCNDDYYYEAEQYCAYLTKIGKADIVLSSDADAFLFGARNVLRKEKTVTKTGKNTYKLFIYNLEELLNGENMTLDDLINIGITLGTDFCHGTPRIGSKTVVKKLKTLESLFDAEQKRAKEIFKMDMIEFNPKISVGNDNKLNEWLKTKNFKKEYSISN